MQRSPSTSSTQLRTVRVLMVAAIISLAASLSFAFGPLALIGGDILLTSVLATLGLQSASIALASEVADMLQKSGLDPFGVAGSSMFPISSGAPAGHPQAEAAPPANSPTSTSPVKTQGPSGPAAPPAAKKPCGYALYGAPVGDKLAGPLIADGTVINSLIIRENRDNQRANLSKWNTDAGVALKSAGDDSDGSHLVYLPRPYQGHEAVALIEKMFKADAARLSTDPDACKYESVHANLAASEASEPELAGPGELGSSLTADEVKKSQWNLDPALGKKGSANMLVAWKLVTVQLDKEPSGSVDVGVVDSGKPFASPSVGFADGFNFVHAGVPDLDNQQLQLYRHRNGQLDANGNYPVGFYADNQVLQGKLRGFGPDATDPGGWDYDYIRQMGVKQSRPYRYHGFRVASILGAKPGSASGLAGALGPFSVPDPRGRQVLMHPYRVFDYWDVMNAIERAAQRKHQVLNISLTIPGMACGKEMQAKVDRFVAQGGIVVASTPNSLDAISAPASCEGVFAVRAHDRNAVEPAYAGIWRLEGSESMKPVAYRVSAPGLDVPAITLAPVKGQLQKTSGGDVIPYPSTNAFNADVMKERVQLQRGSSFAAPVLAATAAMVKLVSPHATTAQFAYYLQFSLDAKTYQGTPILDAPAVIKTAIKLQPPESCDTSTLVIHTDTSSMGKPSQGSNQGSNPGSLGNCRR